MTGGPSDDPPIGVRPGDVLAGKYRVERVLGIGGMGVVVAAHHLQLDEKVALKFLLPHAIQNGDTVARFDREARAAVKIKSEHVARVTDVGRLESGAPYMVMEYLEGADLDAWLAQRGPMSVEQATEFVLQACEAIAEAHALGIVHRDLKPANLFCVRRADGLLAVKVLDFGISKVSTTGPDLGMTQASAVVGSPLYMSPEQIQSSRNVDSRTDIWALGVLLFELVTGKMPFEAETVTELAVLVATATPASLRSIRADVPEGFERAVMRCLQKDRERRFHDVGELAVALREFGPPRAGGSVDRVLRTLNVAGASRPALPSQSDTGEAFAPTVVATSGATAASWTTGRIKKKKDRRVLVGAIAGAGLVLALGGVVELVTRGHAAAPASVRAAPPASVQGPAAKLPAATVAPPAEPVPSTVPSPAPSTAAVPVAPPARPVAAAHAPVMASTKASSSPPVAKPSCDPPYFIDSAGHRQYKPECL